MKIIIK